MNENDILSMMRTARKLYEAMLTASSEEEAETHSESLDAFLNDCKALGVTIIGLGGASTWAVSADADVYEMSNDTLELV